MNVLFVTLKALEINTSVTKSNIGLIKGFIDNGFNVDVLMPEISNELPYFDSGYEELNCNIIRICNNNIGEKIAVKKSKSTGKVINILSFVRKIYYGFKILDRATCLLKQAKNIKLNNTFYDYVVSTSDPKSSHLFVKKLIKNGLNYGKWIQHWGDPLACDITYRGFYPMFCRKIIEKKIIRNADKIVYVSPFTCNYQKKQYRKHESKMFFVPLPCDTSIKNEVLSKHDKVFKIVYLGDYNSKVRNIMPLYNVCKNNQKLFLTIAGNSDLELENLKNIKIYPRLSNKEAGKIESKADIIISICNLYGTQIPGKIYYESSYNKPILVAIDGEYKDNIKDYLESFNRYICCYNNENDIKTKLIELFNQKMIEKKENDYKIPKILLPKEIVKSIIREK